MDKTDDNVIIKHCMSRYTFASVFNVKHNYQNKNLNIFWPLCFIHVKKAIKKLTEKPWKKMLKLGALCRGRGEKTRGVLLCSAKIPQYIGKPSSFSKPAVSCDGV